MQDASRTEVLAQVASKIALELVFAEPGKDNGLLPVNSLLGQMEQAVASEAFPAAIGASVTAARQWIDRVFERDALFDATTLKLLGEWVNWIESAAAAVSIGNPEPALPSHWSAPHADAAASCAAPEVPAAPQEEESGLDLDVGSDAELLREFSSESHEHLQNIELGVLVLEDNPGDIDTLNSIFRAFHTFKGGSGLLNLKPINRLAHELESLLDLARTQKLVITSEIINLILEGGDVLKRFIERIETHLSDPMFATPIQIPVAGLIERVRRVVRAASGDAVAGGEPASNVVPLQALSSAPASAPAAGFTPQTGTETCGAAPGVTMAGSVPARGPSGAVEPARAAGAGGGAEAQGEVRSGTGASVVKVDTLKLDSLVDLVGELVIAQSLVMQDENLKAIDNQHLSRNLAQLRRITADLQRNAMTLRMVPIRATFQKMHRLVRDLGAKSGKQVQLTVSGEDTELDRTIVEIINDPLVHMVRNSVDHGLEKPEQRTGAGKPALGTVHLHACHEGGNIVIEIRDDGAGLNKDRILAKAIEKGVVQPGTQLSEKEIYELIFAPGFSTAEKVTDISGRGVGMDVVRQNVNRLRGKIDVQSTSGQGSRFTLTLPLTLAIIEGLVVGLGADRYIIPSLSVRESFRPTREMICTVHERGEMVQVRGRLIPLLRLHELFGVSGATTEPSQAIVIVVEAGRELRCLLVDRLIGKQEVVIKSLGELLKRHEALAGATILGDGRVGLILDVGALIKSVRRRLSMAA
jgi:two-component system chemotaxis sensor kinase CheA